MPHKRAKLSERVADQERRGKDLPPEKDIHLHSLPKGAMRIIQAAHIQAEYKRKKNEKAKQELHRSAKKEESNLHIRKGERLPDFHRRVESAMAKGIQSSIRATKRANHKQAKATRAASKESRRGRQESIERKGEVMRRKNIERQRHLDDTDQSESDRDWEKAETRRRVNDVVKAPPTMTTAPRGDSRDPKQNKSTLEATLLSGGSAKKSETSREARLPDPIKNGGLRREAILKHERARVIAAYRLNKERNKQTAF